MKCNGRALVGEKLSHLFTDTRTHKFIPNNSSVMPSVQVRCGPHCSSAQPRSVRFTRAVTTLGRLFHGKQKRDEDEKGGKVVDALHSVVR